MLRNIMILYQWFPVVTSQGIHGYFEGCLFFLIQGIIYFVKNNRGTSCIGDVFISYAR